MPLLAIFNEKYQNQLNRYDQVTRYFWTILCCASQFHPSHESLKFAGCNEIPAITDLRGS